VKHTSYDILSKMVLEHMMTIEDGFDKAYVDGAVVILKVMEKWDEGISENYLQGMRDALLFEEGSPNES